MTTNLSNLSSSELRELAAWWKTGTLAECARRVLAERGAAERRLEEANRAAARARSGGEVSGAPLVTLLDGAADLARYARRYEAVAGRASLLREALRRVEREIASIHDAVDAEEDGAEILLARLPVLRVERDRLSLRLAPIEREERDAVDGLASYGLRHA